MSASSDVAPTVRESDGTLHLAFRVASSSLDEDRSAVVSFFGVRDWHYGYPNDEALDAHPLYGHGLKHYQFHRTPIAGHGERAWIATFHDGTFTIFARDLKVVCSGHLGDPRSALLKLLGDGPASNLDGG